LRKFYNFVHFFDSFQQAQQEQIDLLNQLAEKLLHVADQPNREKIQKQNTDINLKWTNTINSIDNQIETLSTILQNWKELDTDFNNIEKGINNLSEKIKDIDFSQKSQNSLEEVKNNILVSAQLQNLIKILFVKWKNDISIEFLFSLLIQNF
jgi:hypothetical protein